MFVLYYMSFSKDNLLILQDIKKDQLLGVENNKIFIDERYLVFYRTKYSVREIIKTLNESFKDCVNKYQEETNEDNKLKIKTIIENALKSYDILSDNYSYREDRKELINTTKDNINKLIKDMDNNCDLEEDTSDSDTLSTDRELNESKEEISTLNYVITLFLDGLIKLSDYMSSTYNFFFD